MIVKPTPPKSAKSSASHVLHVSPKQLAIGTNSSVIASHHRDDRDHRNDPFFYFGLREINLNRMDAAQFFTFLFFCSAAMIRCEDLASA